MTAPVRPLRGFALIVALLIALLGAAPAWACSCAIATLPEQVERAHFVARVAVLATDDSTAGTDGLVRYGMRVDHIWKGPLLSQIIVASASGQAACGIEARVGDELVLFARNEGGSWSTDSCSGTAPAASGVGDEVAALRGAGTPLFPGQGAPAAGPRPTPTHAPAAPGDTGFGSGTAALAAVAAVAAGGIGLLVWAVRRRRA